MKVQMKGGVQIASLLLSLLLLCHGLAYADSEIKLQGFVDVLPAGPGGSLTLPLAPGSSPVIVILSLGIPSVQLEVTITPSTQIEVEEGGLPVTLTDGNLVQLEAVVGSGIIQVTKLEIEEFPEVDLRGTAQGLPPGGVSLPLSPGSTIDFTLSLGVPGGDLPVRLTSDTQIEGGPFLLTNGSAIEVEGVVRDFTIVITEIERD
jgi:hypothetical protein